MVIHYEEALYQMYAHLPLPLPLPLPYQRPNHSATEPDLRTVKLSSPVMCDHAILRSALLDNDG